MWTGLWWVVRTLRVHWALSLAGGSAQVAVVGCHVAWLRRGNLFRFELSIVEVPLQRLTWTPATSKRLQQSLYTSSRGKRYSEVRQQLSGEVES